MIFDRDLVPGLAPATSVAVRLAGHQDRAQFRLLAMAEHVQNGIHNPTGNHHSDANRREHR
jgi:hypothetical protein